MIALVLAVLMVGSVVAPFASASGSVSDGQPEGTEFELAGQSALEFGSAGERDGDRLTPSVSLASTDGTNTSPIRLNETIGEEHGDPGFYELGASGDVAYVPTSSDEITAFDSSGDVVWDTEVSSRSTSPLTVADEMVYVTARDELFAHDAVDGTERWNVTDEGIDIHQSTPAVIGENVYATGSTGSTTPATIHAFEPENGSLVWSEAVADEGSVEFTATDGTVYYATGDVLGALNESTGELEWSRADWPLSAEVSAPLTVHDGVMYVSVSDDVDAVYAIDAANGVPLWRTPVNDDIEVSPVVIGDVVFVGSGQTVHALDTATGAENERYLSGGELLDLAVDGDELLVSSEDGYLYSFDADLATNWEYNILPRSDTEETVGWPGTIVTAGDVTWVVGKTGDELGGHGPDHSIHTLESTALAVTDVDVSTTAAEPGETVTAEATVSNEGTEHQASTVVIEVDGPLTPSGPDEYAIPVDLAAGAETTVSAEFSVDSTGEYVVTALERGTAGAASDPRPEPATVEVTHADPDHDWLQADFDAGGTSYSPHTNAPAGPLQEVWSHNDDTTGIDFGTYPILVEDDTVVVHNGTVIRALDIETGEIEWEYEPIVIADDDAEERIGIEQHAVADGTVYFTTEHYTGDFAWENESYYTRLYALDVSTGGTVWDEGRFHEFAEDIRLNDDLLLVDDNGVYIEVKEHNADETIELRAIVAGNPDAGSEYNKTDEQWTEEIRSAGDYLLYKSNNTLYSLDRGTMAPVSERNFESYEFEFASDGENVYVATRFPSGVGFPEEDRDVGDVYALNPADLWDVRWHAAPDEIYQGTGDYDRHMDMVVTDELLVTAAVAWVSSGPTAHYAFDLETGDLEWWQPHNARVKDSIDAADGVLYAPDRISEDGTNFDLAMGEALVEYDPAGTRQTVVSNGTVLVSNVGPSSSVSALRPSQAPEIDDVALNATAVDPGDTVRLSTTVTNPTDLQMDDVVLYVYRDGGGADDIIDVTLDPGETKTLTWDYEVPDLSTVYGDDNVHVEVANTALEFQDRTVSERVPFAVNEHAVEPSDLEGVVIADPYVPETAAVDDGYTVSVDLVNLADEPDDHLLTIDPDHTTPVERNVTLAAGETVTVTEHFAFDEPVADPEVWIDDQYAGTVTVLGVQMVFEANRTEIDVGETVAFTVWGANFGTAEETATVDVLVENTTIASETRVVGPGENFDEFEVVYTFETAGAFEVGLEVENGTGFDVFDIGTIFVEGADPDYVFTEATIVDDELTVGESVEVDATLENDGGSGEATVELNIWDQEQSVNVGSPTVDVTVPTSGSASFTIEEPITEEGEYLLWLEVYDGDSQHDFIYPEPDTVTVTESVGPTAAFAVDPDQPEVGEAVTLDAGSSSAPDGEIVEYRWDVTDDGTFDVSTDVAETSHTFGEAGDHTVTLEVEDDAGATDVTTETITVEQVDEPEAVLDVIDASLGDDEVEAGDEVTITAEIENTGDATGELAVDLEVDGIIEDTAVVEVEPGESESVEFIHLFAEAGAYPVSVNGVEAGMVTVESKESTPTPTSTPTQEPTPTPTPEPTPTQTPESTPTPTEIETPTPIEEQPGFGLVVALIGLLAAASLAVRRSV